MSWKAMFWASEERFKRPSDKLVLLAFADRHNDETGYAYPSVKWLCDYSGLNRKTVMQCVQRLEDGGYLLDSGRRVGATKQIKVYTVLVPDFKAIPKTGPLENGNSPTFSAEESQKWDTEPSKGTTSTKVDNNKRARPFPDDWQPTDEDRSYAAAQGLSPEEINRAIEDFRDYFIAAGPSRKSTNWSLNWKRWCRTSADQSKRRGARSSRQAVSSGNRQEPVSMAGLLARQRGYT